MASELQERASERVIGRYAIYDEIASGGMAVVHLGRMLGQAGFSRTVAIKRLHPQFAKNPSFVSMFLDEARLAVRVQHPNVVAPLDVLVADGEVLVVMEYVAGETLSRLQRSPTAKQLPPAPSVIVSVMSNALYGLHAAHEALSEDGRPLHIVHRDVSPQNIMVGLNGMARVLDFGVAKATMRAHCTSEGEVKGKLAYMAPEQVEGGKLDRRTDVFAAGIVAWESLSRHRLFCTDDPGATIARIFKARIPPPSKYTPGISPELDQAILRALQRDPQLRYQSAREFAVALERACAPASPSDVGDWVKAVAGDELSARAERVAAVEARSSSSIIRPLQPPPRLSGTLPLKLPPIAPVHVTGGMQAVSQARITIPKLVEGDAGALEISVPNVPAPVGPMSAAAASEASASPLPTRRLGLFVALGVILVMAGGVLTPVVRRLAVGGSTQRQQVPVATSLLAPAAGTTMPAALLTATTAISVDPMPRNGADADASLSTANRAPAAVAESPPDTTVKGAKSQPVRDRRGATTRASTIATLPRSARSVAPPQTTSGKSRDNCAPPYFVDARGIRRLRPECN